MSPRRCRTPDIPVPSLVKQLPVAAQRAKIELLSCVCPPASSPRSLMDGKLGLLTIAFYTVALASNTRTHCTKAYTHAHNTCDMRAHGLRSHIGCVKQPRPRIAAHGILNYTFAKYVDLHRKACRPALRSRCPPERSQPDAHSIEASW